MNKMMPAGKYYIGDPCYVIDGEKWDTFCDKMFDENDTEIRIDKFEGKEIFIHGTAYGDGEYTLIKNGKLIAKIDVDSGTISVLPIELCKQKDIKIENAGFIVHFLFPFDVKYVRGVFYISSYIINTNGE